MPLFILSSMSSLPSIAIARYDGGDLGREHVTVSLRDCATILFTARIVVNINGMRPVYISCSDYFSIIPSDCQETNMRVLRGHRTYMIISRGKNLPDGQFQKSAGLSSSQTEYKDPFIHADEPLPMLGRMARTNRSKVHKGVI